MFVKEPRRSEPARDELENDAGCLTCLVILNVYLEQARSYSTRLRNARVRACLG